jgi:BirA family biotin operon repressor/biotin-[acetyl-CoA-carboxylase] ligase
VDVRFGHGPVLYEAVIDDPLDSAELAANLPPPFHRAVVLASTPSTNAALAAAARDGAAEGLVLAAEHQPAGRGRLDRSWVAPPGAGLTFSVLLRPTCRPEELGWLPLLAGTAVARAVESMTVAGIDLNWPNDVYTPDGKLCGILAEAVAGAVVVGIGLNVHAHPDLPPGATCLAEAGAVGARRTAVLARLLTELGGCYLAWRAEPGAARAEYRSRCRTIGSRVAASLPGGGTVHGRALGVDDIGRLVVCAGGREVALASGDVVRLGPG